MGDNWLSKKVQGYVSGAGNAVGGAINGVGNGVNKAGAGAGNRYVSDFACRIAMRRRYSRPSTN